MHHCAHASRIRAEFKFSGKSTADGSNFGADFDGSLAGDEAAAGTDAVLIEVKDEVEDEDEEHPFGICGGIADALPVDIRVLSHLSCAALDCR